MVLPPLAFTVGEPAGIGPDLAVRIAQEPLGRQLTAYGDPDLLRQRAHQLNRPLRLLTAPVAADDRWQAGDLVIVPCLLRDPVVTAGQLNPNNSASVVKTIQAATAAVLKGHHAALVTGPVHKGVINQAGIPFSGHTELLAELSGCAKVVMMLACPYPKWFGQPHWRSGDLRVALVTTHLPLAQVPAAITAAELEQTLRITHRALQQQWQISDPVLAVSGLNPHAGEGGHLGREELTIITPTLDRLRQQGMQLLGPLPADTLFTPPHLAAVDAVVAMYHDQGLAVLKTLGFGSAVNITLGLPFIRTSVDHGTALDRAGRGEIELGSLRYAIAVAQQMSGFQPRLTHL